MKAVKKLIQSELKKYIRELAEKQIDEYGMSGGMSNMHAGNELPDETIPEKLADGHIELDPAANMDVQITGDLTVSGNISSDTDINPMNIQGGPVDSGHQEPAQDIEDTTPFPGSSFDGNGDTIPLPGTEKSLVEPFGGDMLDNLVDVPDIEDTIVIKDPASLRKLIDVLQNKGISECDYEGAPVQVNKLMKGDKGFKFFMKGKNEVVKKVNLEYNRPGVN